MHDIEVIDSDLRLLVAIRHDERIGDSPAAAYEITNSIPLLDVMVVGHIITEGTLGGQYEYTRDGLIEAGASAQAVEFVIQNMALDARTFRSRLRKDRKLGSVADQRYVFTERPLLLRTDGSLFVLRYQWIIDRFFGGQLQLHWQSSSASARHTPVQSLNPSVRQ